MCFYIYKCTYIYIYIYGAKNVTTTSVVTLENAPGTKNIHWRNCQDWLVMHRLYGASLANRTLALRTDVCNPMPRLSSERALILLRCDCLLAKSCLLAKPTVFLDLNIHIIYIFNYSYIYICQCRCLF